MNNARSPFPRARTFWLVSAVVYVAYCIAVVLGPLPFLMLVPAGPSAYLLLSAPGLWAYLALVPAGPFLLFTVLFQPLLYFTTMPVEPSLFIGVAFWLWAIWGTIGAVKRDRARERAIQEAIPRVAHLHRRPKRPDDSQGQ